MNKDYQAIVFDLYGTLADIRTDEGDAKLWEAFSREMRGCGIDWPPERFRAAFSRLCAEEQARADAALAGTGLPGPAEGEITRVWAAIGSAFGVSWPPEELNAISWLFRRLSTRRLRLFDGAKEVLEALHARGKTVVLLSNAQGSFTRPELDALGIADAFDHIILSSEAGVRKPSPAFFGRLWDLGLQPGSSLMVGNDDLCDCRGADKVGMDSLYIRTEQSPPLSGPLPASCREIRALSDILDILS